MNPCAPSIPFVQCSVLFLVLASCNSVESEGPTSASAMFLEEANYERFMGRWSRPLAPQLIEFAGISSGDHVLDVGTGTGALAHELLQASGIERVVGIDPSASFVDFARDQFHDGRAMFEVGDAQQLRFEDDGFDHCTSLLVVNFIPDAQKAVREMSRVTKSGGVVSAAVWDYSEGMRMLRVFWDEAIDMDPAIDARDERHMPYCRKEELLELWKHAGLIEVSVKALTIDQEFSSFQDFWEPFLLGVGPAGAFVASLDSDQEAELRRRVQARLELEDPAQPFVLQARAWAVRGVTH